MSTLRRSLVAAAALMAAGLSVPALASGDWPTVKPITLIVPFSAGGNVDTTARLIGQKLGERLKQPVVIDNVPGAGGVLGVSKAVKAPADGYTLLMGFDGPISIAQLVNSAVKYDAEKDLTPVGLVTIAPVVAVARPGLPAHNLNELIALVRSKPGSLTYATSGVGTMLHLAMEVLQERAKIKLVHVPYRGGAQIYTGNLGTGMDFSGISKRSAQNSRQPFIMPNSSYWDGSKYVDNTSIYMTGGYNFWSQATNQNANTNYLVSGDFWKIREMSLSYNIPAKVFGFTKNAIKGATFTLSGRNLFMFLPKTNEWTDPEFANTTGNAQGVSGLDNTPPTRIFGATLNLNL